MRVKFENAVYEMNKCIISNDSTVEDCTHVMFTDEIHPEYVSVSIESDVDEASLDYAFHTGFIDLDKNPNKSIIRLI